MRRCNHVNQSASLFSNIIAAQYHRNVDVAYYGKNLDRVTKYAGLHLMDDQIPALKFTPRYVPMYQSAIVYASVVGSDNVRTFKIVQLILELIVCLYLWHSNAVIVFQLRL